MASRNIASARDQQLTAPATNEEWLAFDSKYALQSWPKCGVVLERGKGCWLWDVEGKKYLDFMSGQLCVSVGHSNDELLEAIRIQAARLMQTGSSFATKEEATLAKVLSDISPGGPKKSFFGCTGSDSNDTALRMAKFYDSREELVGLVGGYHGLSYGSWSITSRGFRQARPQYGVGLPGVTFIPLPEEYRCHFCQEQGKCNMRCFDYSVSFLDETTSGYPAAVFVEPIVGGTVTVPRTDYLKRLREFCTERGALLIVDEAVTGIGRTGKWFGFEHFDIVPDIITLSKALGGSVPLSAVVINEEVAEKLERNGYISTASHRGDPFLCAVALENIRIIREHDLIGNAGRVGAHMMERLKELKDRYEIVGDVRGIGLFLGIEIVRDKTSREPAVDLTDKITSRCLDLGLIVFTTPGIPVIRLTPPLMIGEAEADEGLSILERAIRTVVD